MNRRSVLGLPGGLAMLNINTDIAVAYGRRRRDRTSFDSIEYDHAQLLDYQHPAPQAHQDPDQEIDLLNDDSHLPPPPRIPPPPTPPQPVYQQAGQQQMKGTTPLRVLNLAGYTDGDSIDLDRKSAPELRELYRHAGNTPISSPATPWANESPRAGSSWATSPSTPRLGSIFSTASNTPTTPKPGSSFGYSPATPRLGTSWATSPSTTRPSTSYTSSPTTPRPGTAFSLLSRDTSIGTLPDDIPVTVMVTTTVSVDIETVADRKAIDSADYRTICSISYVDPFLEIAEREESSERSFYISEQDEEKMDEVKERPKVAPAPVIHEERNYTYSPNADVFGFDRREGQGLGIGVGVGNTTSGTTGNEGVEFLKKFGMTPKKVVGAVKKVRNMFGRV
ncbi:hypothetical protein TWF718_001914 [Orbilia javanica]|uniref:Uncharacterized protein n=1 Tax=Orbilia javanica TaxID=47235 RepID=A0AAN8N1I3_9PEZI